MSTAYPTQNLPPQWPAAVARNESARTAESVVFVGLLLQVIGGVLVLGGVGWFFGFSLLHPFPWAWAGAVGAGVVAVLVVLFLYVAYAYAYRPIRAGQFAEAQTPTLVIGVLSLFLGVLPGIFYLIGYVKLGDALREAATPPTGFAPGTLIACRSCGRVYPVTSFAFCPSCGQKLGA